MPTRKRQLLIAVFVFAAVLLNYPLLYLPEQVGPPHFPLTLLYLLVVWVGIIISVSILTSTPKTHK
ncbi:MAG: hypothetical protein AAF840_13165 [Bacteroidota bacterium]